MVNRKMFFDPLFTSIALGHFTVDIFNSSRPVLLTYFGLSETQIAVFTTIYIWASALTQPIFGWISDRVGPRWLAAGGVLWMTVFYSATLLFPGPVGLTCFVVAALGSSAFHPVGTVQATLQGRNHMKGRETTATSIFFTAGQMGHFLGPIATGLILALLGVRGMFIFPLLSIPVGLMIAMKLRSNTPHPHPSQGQPNRLKVGWLFILALALVATFQSWAQSNIINLMPKYLKDLGQTATVYGSMAGLFMGGSALGNIIGGHFGDKYPKRFVAAFALFFGALPIYILSQIGWSAWLYVLVPLAGACTGAVHSIMVVLAQRLIPGGMALASGLALGFIFSSGALGLLYTGPVAEVRGFPFVLILTTGLVLAAAPMALLLREPSVKTESAQVELQSTAKITKPEL